MTGHLLVLLRHGQSEWNLANRFTGARDVDLTPAGAEEAGTAGRRIKACGIRFDAGFASALRRASRSLDIVLDAMDQKDIPTVRSPALNERDYGDLTGLDKNAARERWGAARVHIWRRSHEVAPPGGESLKDVAARVLPFYRRDIVPRVLRGERILVVAHEHSLRALVMELERLDAAQIVDRELATGVPAIYRIADEDAPERLELTT